MKEHCSSNTDELRKQILYLETYSRRENLTEICWHPPKRLFQMTPSLMSVKNQARTQRQLLHARGIRDLYKPETIFTWINKQKVDIVFLQETYSSKEIENHFKLQWRGRMLFTHGTNHSKGILILFSENLQIRNVVSKQNRLSLLGTSETGCQGLLWITTFLHFQWLLPLMHENVCRNHVHGGSELSRRVLCDC